MAGTPGHGDGAAAAADARRLTRRATRHGRARCGRWRRREAFANRRSAGRRTCVRLRDGWRRAPGRTRTSPSRSSLARPAVERTDTVLRFGRVARRLGQLEPRDSDRGQGGRVGLGGECPGRPVGFDACHWYFQRARSAKGIEAAVAAVDAMAPGLVRLGVSPSETASSRRASTSWTPASAGSRRPRRAAVVPSSPRRGVGTAPRRPLSPGRRGRRGESRDAGDRAAQLIDLVEGRLDVADAGEPLSDVRSTTSACGSSSSMSAELSSGEVSTMTRSTWDATRDIRRRKAPAPSDAAWLLRVYLGSEHEQRGGPAGRASRSASRRPRSRSSTRHLGLPLARIG